MNAVAASGIGYAALAIVVFSPRLTPQIEPQIELDELGEKYGRLFKFLGFAGIFMLFYRALVDVRVAVASVLLMVAIDVSFLNKKKPKEREIRVQ